MYVNKFLAHTKIKLIQSFLISQAAKLHYYY